MVHRSNRCTVPLVSQWGKQDKKENDMSRKTKEAVQGAIYILPSFVLILIFCIMNRPPEVRPKNLTIGGRFSYGKI